MEVNRVDTTGDDLHLATAAAKMHYLENASKVAIADRLGISRFKVARLLEIARKQGIVSITIREPYGVDETLSQRLQDVLGVERALVTDGLSDPLDRVSALTARYLTNTSRDGAKIGLAWSRSSGAIIKHLDRLPARAIVQLCGVVTENSWQTHNVELVRSAAERAGTDAVTFYAPLVLPDPTSSAALRDDPGIARALEHCDSLDTAVIMIGMWAPGKSSVFDVLAPSEQQEFHAAGAVAETCGILFDERGVPLAQGLQERTIGVTTEQLRRTPDVVAFVVDPERTAAVISLAKSGIISTLITHTNVAHQVLADARVDEDLITRSRRS